MKQEPQAIKLFVFNILYPFSSSSVYSRKRVKISEDVRPNSGKHVRVYTTGVRGR